MIYDYILLDTQSNIPLYQQLYLAIKSAIEAGHLAKGEKMPSIRKLSQDLKLSCTTVDAAYQQLCVEGYLQAKPQRGYFVMAVIRSGIERQKKPVVGTVKMKRPGIRYNFGSDCVDSENIDIKIWRRHIREVLNRQDIIASYGEHQGEYALREALSAYSYGVRGVIAAPEQIVIGAGTQPLLSVLCGLLSGKENCVAIEEPGFLQAEQVFSDAGIRVLHLPADESGISIAALKESGTGLVFVSPSNRILTGTSIPMNRRYELLEWAEETGGILIEDDYNGELRYKARPIPAMQGMGNGRNIVYLGSFSKLLLPSVRVGYMVLPPLLLERYRERASHYNQTASKIEQLALSRYVEDGQMERQLRRLRKLYLMKSSALAEALENAFGDKIQIMLEETPLCLAVSVSTEKTSLELCELAQREGVRVMMMQSDCTKVMLGFAGIPLDDIQPAVACLKKAWSFLG